MSGTLFRPMALLAQPDRAPWDPFPDIVIVAAESAVKKHPDYEQAKQGNVQDAAPAAKRLASALLTTESVVVLQALPVEGTRLVPVHAIENQGLNRIPAAFAELLGAKLGLDIETAILQSNVVNHTGASGWVRLASPPLFDGAVQSGQGYLLVDDFVGQGSTLANLRGHIVLHGGRVVGAVCLTGRGDSSKLALTLDTLERLRNKHGSEIEAWWLKKFGFVSRMLTPSELAFLRQDLEQTIELARKTKVA